MQTQLHVQESFSLRLVLQAHQTSPHMDKSVSQTQWGQENVAGFPTQTVCGCAGAFQQLWYGEAPGAAAHKDAGHR